MQHTVAHPLALMAVILFSASDGVVRAVQPRSSDLYDRGYQDYKMRREQNGVHYNYTTQWIDESICGEVEERVCQDMDEEYGIQVQKKLDIIRDVNDRRRRLSKSTDTKNGRELQDLTPTGSFKVLVLLMRWSDHADVDIVPREDYDRMFNADPSDIGSTVIPTGSVRRYFEVNSYNKLTFEATVADWQTTDNPEAFYAGSNQGRNPALQESMRPLLENLDSQGFDFSTVDGDGDDIIDLVVLLHSGYASEEGGLDERFSPGVPPENRIQSHSTAATPLTLTWRSSTGIRVGQYAVASAFRLRSGANIIRLGIPTHEMFHNFGLLDLYDNDFLPDLQSSGNIGGIDRYGLMANTGGQRNNKARPGHLSAWSKERLGFVEPTVITTDGTYTARPVELFPDVFRINLSPTEYLLIENRQPIESDFDERFFGEGGILIYKIDAAVTEPLVDRFGGNRDRGFPGQPGWPANGNHYGVAVLQADSLGTPGGLNGYDLEKFVNGGEEEDLWLSATQSLSPGTAESEAFSDIYPNTDLYSVATGVGTSGVTVSNFRRMEGQTEGPYTYMFDVGGLLDDGTNSPSQTPTEVPATNSPSQTPSNAPSNSPSLAPSNTPSQTPTNVPATNSPSQTPSSSPSSLPSASPSQQPSDVAATNSPSTTPSIAPSQTPTDVFVTNSPSAEPTDGIGDTDMPSLTPSGSPSASPSALPSQSPSTPMPNVADQSDQPSTTPSRSNSPTTSSPSSVPTTSAAPTDATAQDSSGEPSVGPSNAPSVSPSTSPSRRPSANPSALSERPSVSPTMNQAESEVPSSSPSAFPTESFRPSVAGATNFPSQSPTTAFPSLSPSVFPSAVPTSLSPTRSPSVAPSGRPSVFVPSVSPSAAPTDMPSASPSSAPTAPVAQPTRPPGHAPVLSGGTAVVRNSGQLFPPSPNPPGLPPLPPAGSFDLDFNAQFRVPQGGGDGEGDEEAGGPNPDDTPVASPTRRTSTASSSTSTTSRSTTATTTTTTTTTTTSSSSRSRSASRRLQRQPHLARLAVSDEFRRRQRGL